MKPPRVRDKAARDPFRYDWLHAHSGRQRVTVKVFTSDAAKRASGGRERGCPARGLVRVRGAAAWPCRLDRAPAAMRGGPPCLRPETARLPRRGIWPPCRRRMSAPSRPCRARQRQTSAPPKLPGCTPTTSSTVHIFAGARRWPVGRIAHHNLAPTPSPGAASRSGARPFLPVAFPSRFRCRDLAGMARRVAACTSASWFGSPPLPMEVTKVNHVCQLWRCRLNPCEARSLHVLP